MAPHPQDLRGGMACLLLSLVMGVLQLGVLCSKLEGFQEQEQALPKGDGGERDVLEVHHAV